MPVPEHPRASSYYHSHCGETETQCVRAATTAGLLVIRTWAWKNISKMLWASTVTYDCNPSHWTAEEGGLPHIKVSLKYVVRSCLKNAK